MCYFTQHRCLEWIHWHQPSLLYAWSLSHYLGGLLPNCLERIMGAKKNSVPLPFPPVLVATFPQVTKGSVSHMCPYKLTFCGEGIWRQGKLTLSSIIVQSAKVQALIARCPLTSYSRTLHQTHRYYVFYNNKILQGLFCLHFPSNKKTVSNALLPPVYASLRQ